MSDFSIKTWHLGIMKLWRLFISPGLSGFLPCSDMGRESYDLVMPSSGGSPGFPLSVLWHLGERDSLSLMSESEGFSSPLCVGCYPLAGSTRTPYTAPQTASPTPWWRLAYLPLSGGKVLTFLGLLWHQLSTDDTLFLLPVGCGKLGCPHGFSDCGGISLLLSRTESQLPAWSSLIPPQWGFGVVMSQIAGGRSLTPIQPGLVKLGTFLVGVECLLSKRFFFTKLLFF